MSDDGELRRILAAYRAGTGASKASRARVARRLDATIGASLGVPMPEKAGTAAASGAGIKIVVVAVVSGAALVAALSTGIDDAPPDRLSAEGAAGHVERPSTRPATTQRSEVTEPPRIEASGLEPPVAVPEPAPASAPVLDGTRAGSRARPRTADIEPEAGSTDPEEAHASTLRAETELLGRVEAALRRSDPTAALAILAGYEAEFPDGLLDEEARALELVARCRTGDAGASQAALGFLETHVRSRFARRIRRACEGVRP
jgi:hypothetical protein